MTTATDSPTTSAGPMGLSRNALIVIAAVALLAIVGWWRAIDKSGQLEALQQRSAATEAELNAKVAGLESDVGSVTQRLADTEKANGDLEAVQAKLQAAGSSLNERLAVLGEREQQAATAEGEVQKHAVELEALEDRMAAAASKLSQRLSVLGERELHEGGV